MIFKVKCDFKCKMDPLCLKNNMFTVRQLQDNRLIPVKVSEFLNLQNKTPTNFIGFLRNLKTPNGNFEIN